MSRITISLPDELARLVEYEAGRTGVSVSEVIRESITKALLGTRPREIPWAGICDDPAMPPARSFEQALKSWTDADRRRR